MCVCVRFCRLALLFKKVRRSVVGCLGRTDLADSISVDDGDEDDDDDDDRHSSLIGNSRRGVDRPQRVGASLFERFRFVLVLYI